MSAVDLAAVIVTVVCLATVVVLTVAVVSLVRTMRELRDVVDDLRDSALPMVDDLRTTVTKADAELHRVDRVIGRAERIAATADHASRLTYRAFAPPLIKGLSLVSGAGQAGRRLRERRRHRRSLDLAANDSAAAAREVSTTVEATGDSSAPAREISTTAEAAAASRPAATRPSHSGNTGRTRTRRRRR
ncbi:MAG: hypothetical protein J4F50_00350 [Acidimicrobiia bacterium]|nr:hypothetical protein [Acidimicrobiia bacterium]